MYSFVMVHPHKAFLRHLIAWTEAWQFEQLWAGFAAMSHIITLVDTDEDTIDLDESVSQETRDTSMEERLDRSRS